MTGGGFPGFPPQAPAFLKALAANNRRDWFHDHKAEYQSLIRDPLRRLVEALAPQMTAIDPRLDGDPLGPAVSRIQRDTRFSKDKSPYRLRQWLAFKTRSENWASRPTFFVGFGAETWRWGMGYYAATPTVMAAVRAAAEKQPDRFAGAITELYRVGASLEGDGYRRPRAQPDLPQAVQDLCNRKSPYAACLTSIGPLFFSPALAQTVADGFHAAAPLYGLLNDVAAALTASQNAERSVNS